MINLSELNPKNKVFKQRQLHRIAELQLHIFDNATNPSYISMKKKLEDLPAKEISLQDQLSNYLEDNDGVPTSKDMKLIQQIMEIDSDRVWANAHLNAIAEMKIVYIFKSLEITMKSLIKMAYPNVDLKGFYKWETMIAYLKSVGIVVSDVDGYIEANELRLINNNIKHGNMINHKVQKIREFTKASEFDFEDIELFCMRIKGKIEDFLKQISQLIINNLFVFEGNRAIPDK